MDFSLSDGHSGVDRNPSTSMPELLDLFNGPVDDNLPSLQQVFAASVRNMHALTEQTSGKLVSFCDGSSPLLETDSAEKLIELQDRLTHAKEQVGDSFSLLIWDCCQSKCFARLAITNQRKFREVLRVGEQVRKLHKAATESSATGNIHLRTRGTGRSSIGFVTDGAGRGRAGLAVPDQMASERSTRIRIHHEACAQGYAFLTGNHERHGLTVKLCTRATREVLDISLSGVYKIRIDGMSLIDECGSRARVGRRSGNRSGYPDITSLPSINCGCAEEHGDPLPCLRSFEVGYLEFLWQSFLKCSTPRKPRKAEQEFLLRFLHCQVTNRDVLLCNQAVSDLFAVGTSLVQRLRILIRDKSTDYDHGIMLPEHGMSTRRRLGLGPVNRTRTEIINSISDAMDLCLRADPGAVDGCVALRPCCVEVNSHRKLRKLLVELSVLESEEDLDSSTFDRIIKAELERRQCRLTFAKRDHNVCPHCKAWEHLILRLTFEIRLSERDNGNREIIAAKEARLKEELHKYETHNLRDARIRKYIHRLTDFFKSQELKSREEEKESTGLYRGFGWRQRKNHGLLWHQDDSTKINVPHFCIQSQSDITAFRQDLNAHVSAITNEAIVFTHDQGMSSKNGSSIVETMIFNLLLSCRGEDVVIVVSDCAAAGRNYVTTVAAASYIVDNGLAGVVVVAFLENCHGKYLADLLFGQFQRSARNANFVSVDDMLDVVGSLQRRGRAQGFVVNPLACTDWKLNFQQLGYEVSPPSDLKWQDRDIHFACAASANAKQCLCEELMVLLEPLMPSEPGMVRLSYAPPGESDGPIPFEKRPIDVPAASSFCMNETETEMAQRVAQNWNDDLRVVQSDTPFKNSGDRVVSQKTASDLGYNAINWLRRSAELQNRSDIRARLWPPDYRPFDVEEGARLQIDTDSCIKTAPENWVIRKPLSAVARYPPRNFVNAVSGAGPREQYNRVATQTYYEPPFPVIEHTSADEGMKMFEETARGRLEESMSTLELLCHIYREKGDRSESERNLDRHWQRRAPFPSALALTAYIAVLQRSAEREVGRPKAAKSAYQLFKSDTEIGVAINEQLKDLPAGKEKNDSRTALFKELWLICRGDPNKSAKYVKLAEEDDARYERDMVQFRAAQSTLDQQVDQIELEREEEEAVLDFIDQLNEAAEVMAGQS